MAAKALPSPEVLRQLLTYEPGTGNLYWAHRDCSFFLAEVRSAQHDAAIWNRLYSGQKAFQAILQNGYLAGQVLQRKMLAHRVAWAIHYGVWPDGQIDHINRVKSDNRIANLRAVSASVNAANRSSATGKPEEEIGVFPARKGKFKAAISAGGKSRYLGTFLTKEDARKAYLAAKSQYSAITQDRILK